MYALHWFADSVLADSVDEANVTLAGGVSFRGLETTPRRRRNSGSD